MSVDNHYDFDADETLTTPITFRLNKKDYTVRKITGKLLIELEKLDEKAEAVGAPDGEDKATEQKGEPKEREYVDQGDLMATYLHVLTGAPKKEFEDLPLPTACKVVRWVSKQVRGSLSAPLDEQETSQTSGASSQDSDTKSS